MCSFFPNILFAAPPTFLLKHLQIPGRGQDLLKVSDKVKPFPSVNKNRAYQQKAQSQSRDYHGQGLPPWNCHAHCRPIQDREKAAGSQSSRFQPDSLKIPYSKQAYKPGAYCQKYRGCQGGSFTEQPFIERQRKKQAFLFIFFQIAGGEKG